MNAYWMETNTDKCKILVNTIGTGNGKAEVDMKEVQVEVSTALSTWEPSFPKMTAAR